MAQYNDLPLSIYLPILPHPLFEDYGQVSKGGHNFRREKFGAVKPVFNELGFNEIPEITNNFLTNGWSAI